MLTKKINVAVAVIVFQSDKQSGSNELFLLGYRNAKQHQGERFEFVGGKIEAAETAVGALIREVNEEVGIKLVAAQCSEMGQINHDYTDKQVCLHVFKVLVCAAQYQQLVDKDYGNLNQPLVWATKADLLAGKYPLPEANAIILHWLSAE